MSRTSEGSSTAAWPPSALLQNLQAVALKFSSALPFKPGKRNAVFTTSSKPWKAAPRQVTFSRRAPFAAIIPGDSVVETVVTTGLGNFLNLYNSALIVRLVLTWFPNPPEFIVSPLSTLCDPYLNLFRGLIPPLGGTLDFSPILAFVVLSLFSNTAAALPAELPQREPQARLMAQQPAGLGVWRQSSKYEQAWHRRILGGQRLRKQRQERHRTTA